MDVVNLTNLCSTDFTMVSLFAQVGAAPTPSIFSEVKITFPWIVTIGITLLLFGLLMLVLYGTRIGIIARATVKEAVRQPMFLLSLVVAFGLLLLNTFWPFFLFGEEAKMLKDCGLATILFSGLMVAIWTASTSIADEIEGKTAMTLLSKPINRRQFIVGKYVGILTTTLLIMTPQAIALLFCIFYRAGYYDARESSKEALPAAQILVDTLQILPGILLVYMEIAAMSAVSVAISTRAPMVVNMVSCLAIFVVGHLTPALVGSAFRGLELVLFFARMISSVLPSLSSYNIEAAIATGRGVPADYLGVAFGYTVAYVGIALLMSFILFEDRDLA